jgi:tRNA modification GTPase
MEHQPADRRRRGQVGRGPIGARDTIVAIATAPGRGGVGVVRLSGQTALIVAERIAGSLPPPREARLARFVDEEGALIDVGLVLVFPEPNSFTGEDVVELQAHGGPVVLDTLVERAVQLGARRARPGEFSERAFLNDKLDLVQAEAIADLIDAGSQQAARAALRSLQGEFSKLVDRAVTALTRLRVYVEAAIDFPEEEIDFLSGEELSRHLLTVREHLDRVQAAARQGRLLSRGLHVVIAGRPNAGKSTLLNRLAGHDAAIVSPLPGTTRDLLRERIDLDGLPLHVVDTAGLREVTVDDIEREGIRRARDEITRADRVLFVIDAAVDPDGASLTEEAARLPSGVPVTRVFNKCDLAGRPAGPGAAPDTFWLSAVNGTGLEPLRAHLKAVAGFAGEGDGALSARARHVEALERARSAFERAVEQLARRQGELVAEELRIAQQALGEITGAVTSDALLGEIFTSFCIGK